MPSQVYYHDGLRFGRSAVWVNATKRRDWCVWTDLREKPKKHGRLLTSLVLAQRLRALNYTGELLPMATDTWAVMGGARVKLHSAHPTTGAVWALLEVDESQCLVAGALRHSAGATLQARHLVVEMPSPNHQGMTLDAALQGLMQRVLHDGAFLDVWVDDLESGMAVAAALGENNVPLCGSGPFQKLLTWHGPAKTAPVRLVLAARARPVQRRTSVWLATGVQKAEDLASSPEVMMPLQWYASWQCLRDFAESCEAEHLWLLKPGPDQLEQAQAFLHDIELHGLPNARQLSLMSFAPGRG